MAKTIIETTILTSIAIRSIMFYKDAEGVLVSDVCWDVLKEDGSLYETKHADRPVPDKLASVISAVWDTAETVCLTEEGI